MMETPSSVHLLFGGADFFQVNHVKLQGCMVPKTEFPPCSMGNTSSTWVHFSIAIFTRVYIGSKNSSSLNGVFGHFWDLDQKLILGSWASSNF